MDSLDLVNCQYCGDEEACIDSEVYFSFDTEPPSHNGKQVSCTCGVSGPVKKTSTEALEAWNLLFKK